MNTTQTSKLVGGEIAALAANVAPNSDAYLFLVSPEERTLLLAIENGQTVTEIAKSIGVPEADLRAAVVESVQRLAFYAVALRRGRIRAEREDS